MIVRGREIGFLRTVKTSCDIEALCPNHDLSRFDELLNGSVASANRTVAEMIRILNEGYEMNRKFNEEGYEPHVLTLDEILYLDDSVFQELAEEAMKAFNKEKQTVEVETKKKEETVAR